MSRVKRVAAYAVGVWGGLTAWAALAQYVLPGRGHALGKLGSFYWVLLINVLPALLCGLGFAIGFAVSRSSGGARASGGRVALAGTLALGLVFPLSLRLLRPVFVSFDAGMIPALVWSLLGSVGAAWLLARWEQRGAREPGAEDSG